MHFNFGGDFALLEATFDDLGLSDTDKATGFWLSGGLIYVMSENIYIGADLRSAMADVTLFGVSADAGGGQFGVIPGLSF